MSVNNRRVTPGRGPQAVYLRESRKSRLPPLTDEQVKFVEAYLDADRDPCRIKARIFSRKYPRIDFWDYYQAAFEGLAEAVRTYDPDLRVPFEAFADARMTGACKDLMRENGLIRLKHRRNRPRFGFRPVEADDLVLGTSGDDLLSDEAFESILSVLEPPEPELMRLYYGPEALCFREIAARMGHTASWASRLHASIIEKLRATYSADWLREHQQTA